MKERNMEKDFGFVGGTNQGIWEERSGIYPDGWIDDEDFGV